MEEFAKCSDILNARLIFIIFKFFYNFSFLFIVLQLIFSFIRFLIILIGVLFLLLIAHQSSLK